MAGPRESKFWSKTCTATCAAQMVCGLVGFFLTSAYLYDYTKSTGQLLSLILTAVGGVGCAGAAKKNRNLLNVHFLGIAVAILLSFHFISQVGRETQVDCALAELYLRNHATEDNLRKQNSMDMFTNVFHRINELEDMMRAVQDGAVKAIEAKAEQHRLKLTDRNYMKAKLEMLKRHTEEVFEKVANHPNITEADKHGEMDAGTRRKLIKRIDQAEELLEKVNGYMDDETKLTYEEYDALLRGLIEAYVAEPSLREPHHQVAKAQLRQAHMELPNMRAAIERQKADTYHELSAGPAGEHLSAMERARQMRQHEWNLKLEEAISSTTPGSNYEPLEKMPQHCLLGVQYFNIMEYFGVALMAFQLASAYCVLSLMIRIPIKTE